MPKILSPSAPRVLASRMLPRIASAVPLPRETTQYTCMRGAMIWSAADSACHCLLLTKLPPFSRVSVTPLARYRLRSYWIGIAMPARSSCQCMCVLTRPGMTYLPVASITASASIGMFGAMVAMTPSWTRMSIGP